MEEEAIKFINKLKNKYEIENNNLYKNINMKCERFQEIKKLLQKQIEMCDFILDKIEQ